MNDLAKVKWTDERRERVVTAYRQGRTPIEIARQLTAEWGARVTPSMVSGIVSRAAAARATASAPRRIQA